MGRELGYFYTLELRFWFTLTEGLFVLDVG